MVQNTPDLQKLDWNKLPLRGIGGRCHVECYYSPIEGKWSAPAVVEDPYLRVHGMSPGLNYGQQIFEGMKAFRHADGSVNIFRPEKHANRFNHSGSFVIIPKIEESLFIESIRLAVSKNLDFVPPHDSPASLYIRPIAFGSGEMLGLGPCAEYTFCVFVQPINAYHGSMALDAVIVEEFDRAAPMGTGSAKVGGNYAPVVKYAMKARQEGFGLTLHLDSKTRTEIDEFSTSAFIGIKSTKIDGKDLHVMVMPDTQNAIDSVTGDCCVQLARDFGWAVEKRSIKYEELESFSEVTAAGTAAALVPVRSITCRSKNQKFSFSVGSADGQETCTMRLSRALLDIQKGNSGDTFGWCSPVESAVASVGNLTLEDATRTASILGKDSSVIVSSSVTEIAAPLVRAQAAQ